MGMQNDRTVQEKLRLYQTVTKKESQVTDLDSGL